MMAPRHHSSDRAGVPLSTADGLVRNSGAVPAWLLDPASHRAGPNEPQIMQGRDETKF